MDLSGEYIFDAPQELTWKALQDPDVLASVMPGGEDFKEIGENEYSGLLNIKVGPVQGKFKGTIKLTDIAYLDGYSIQVDGKGAPGFVKANGRLRLTSQEGKTHMTYEGHAQIGGRIARVGQRLVESSAKSIIRQSLDGLNEYLKVQVAANQLAEAASTPADETVEVLDYPAAPRYTPPSQTDAALNVFKDIIRDFVPSQYRPAVITSLVILVLLIIYWILKN